MTSNPSPPRGIWKPGRVDHVCSCGQETGFDYAPPGIAISPTWTCGNCGRHVTLIDEAECEPVEFGEFLRDPSSLWRRRQERMRAEIWAGSSEKGKQ